MFFEIAPNYYYWDGEIKEYKRRFKDSHAESLKSKAYKGENHVGDIILLMSPKRGQNVF